MNRPSPLLAAALSLAPALATFSCTQRSDQGGVTSSAAQAVVAPSAPAASGSGAPRTPKWRAPAGVVGLFFRAAEPLDLTSSQRTTISKLQQQMHADAANRTARDAFRSDLAAEIRAGALDKAKLAADEAEIAKAIASDRDARLAALDGLHDVLDSAQRKTVAGDVRENATRTTPHHGPWDASDAGPPYGPSRRLERLTRQLGLDPSQQKDVAALLSKSDHPSPPDREDVREAAKRRLDMLLTSFEQDSFDAGAALEPPADAGRGGLQVHERLEHEVGLLGQLLPILTAEQRDRLAVLVEKQHAFDWRGATEPAGDPMEDGEWDRPGAAWR